jgi:hypothetical protein
MEIALLYSAHIYCKHRLFGSYVGGLGDVSFIPINFFSVYRTYQILHREIRELRDQRVLIINHLLQYTRSDHCNVDGYIVNKVHAGQSNGVKWRR